MCPDSSIKRQQGFALMAALFIIVTLAAIGAYLLTVSTGQVAAASQDEEAARAYQAARTGVDWAAYRVLIGGGCPAPTDLHLPRNFIAQVTCSAAVETEGAQEITAYTVISTGCNATACGPPTPPATMPATYVERQLQLTLSKCTSAGC
jgi:MSHA biogenesis protein MshP